MKVEKTAMKECIERSTNMDFMHWFMRTDKGFLNWKKSKYKRLMHLVKIPLIKKTA